MVKIFKNFSKKEYFLMLIAVVFVVISVWCDLTVPDYMSEITMLVQSSGSEMSDILVTGGKMLLFSLGSFAATVITSACAARLAAGLGKTLRGRLFHKVQSFSMEEVGRFSTSSLITRTTNDVVQVQMLIIFGFQMIVKAPITAVWAILKIYGKSDEWTVTTAVAVAILMVIIGVCVAVAFPKYRKMQTLTDNLNRIARENLTGINVVRAYNAEKYQEKKFEVANRELTSAQLFTQRTMSFLMPSIQLVMSGLSLAVFWVGAYLIDAAGLAEKAVLFSDMVVFSSYAMQVVMAFMMLVMIFIMMPRALVSAGRINEVLDTKLSVVDGAKQSGKEGSVGEVEFKNVSFRYPGGGECVLENISFTAKGGETVAFIGATGCGKSTLVNLIPRFYDVTEGSVTVDGVDVREYSQKALRRKIAYASQKATAFSGTVRSNIEFGDNTDGMISVEDAVETAQASDFVKNQKDGYDGYVAQGGTNFSGGQKQRLSIARAVARNAEIMIFDDTFSALDYKTDKALRKELREKYSEKTVLMVAQRIGTVIDADKIIVLDDGKIVGMGRHAELLENCEVYRQIALSQLSKEELA